MKQREGSPINRWVMCGPASNRVRSHSSGIKMTCMQQSGGGLELYLNCFHEIDLSHNRVMNVTDVESTLL